MRRTRRWTTAARRRFIRRRNIPSTRSRTCARATASTGRSGNCCSAWAWTGSISGSRPGTRWAASSGRATAYSSSPTSSGTRTRSGGVESLIAQGSVIRAIADYAYIALQGQGKLTIGDSPQLETDFDEVVRATGIGKIAYYYGQHGMSVDILNLMQVRGRTRKIGGVAVRRLAGDPLGYKVVDLKADSEHYDIIADCGKFRVADYDRREMIKHHNREKNEYCISASVLDADVVISVPKLKTHAKTGMTGALKNMIGINGAKDWLPHHRAGSAESGGDEYLRSDLRKDVVVRLKEEMVLTDNLLRIVPMRAMTVALILSRKVRPYNDPCQQGGWHGNDTIPRTIVDMNKILLYADQRGHHAGYAQRRLFVLVDGIVAGEKEGPMTPDAPQCGVLVAGYNPVEVDAACCGIMGFDYRKIPAIRHALNARRYRLFDGRVSETSRSSPIAATASTTYSTPTIARSSRRPSWKGHIEYEPSTPDALPGGSARRSAPDGEVSGFSTSL